MPLVPAASHCTVHAAIGSSAQGTPGDLPGPTFCAIDPTMNGDDTAPPYPFVLPRALRVRKKGSAAMRSLEELGAGVGFEPTTFRL